jgi:translation initiation factor 5B
MQVAVSMDKPIVGRHVFEKDVLYVKVPEPDVRVLMSTYLDKLTEDEQEVLKEYVAAMRKKVPFWGAF